ncbi:hypothetical protein SADUNF_Sadunf16G0036400 [Salix dunnii]|uniref:Uncharacterized protein n=1 Tax=Salix dunnii TaxID=1413687 RepID=A0A835MKT4_9ROSI|nr:hypothetical protein SADUNF_Sadunf16G0036400 [Salix dunnii]
MFLDGCFILQFISCFLHKPEDLKMPGHHIALVKRDLLLLENPLPFQVISSLMDLRFGGEAGGGNTSGTFVHFLLDKSHSRKW